MKDMHTQFVDSDLPVSMGKKHIQQEQLPPNDLGITGGDRDVKSKPATRCADGGYADLFDGLRRGGERRNADKKRHETKPSSHPWICVVQNLRVSPKKMRRVGTWIIGPWFQRGYVYSYIMDGNGGNSHIFYFHL